MPWDVRENFGNCQGFAVVKSDTDEIVACHTDKAVADQHVVDLYAAEGSDPMMASADEMKKKRRRKQEYDEHGNMILNTDLKLDEVEFVPDTQFIPSQDRGTYIQ